MITLLFKNHFRHIVAIWADPSYANNELGWRAERSLDETLAAAWKWEKHIRGIE